jgi:hypothetical protein
MKFIAHRGNTTGKRTEFENKPFYIDEALHQGFDVEIDIWIKDNRIYLGHDGPEVLIDIDFLNKRKKHLWCHAKNLAALQFLLKNDFHCFFHDIDAYTITSKGIIWTYPGNYINENTICVMPERYMTKTEINDMKNLSVCFGICSDVISIYKNEIIYNNI